MILVPELDLAFAAPPRCGNHWFLSAMEMLGYAPKVAQGLHDPFPDDVEGFRVTMVRHPYDWLVSYYYAIHGAPLDCPSDAFSELARRSKSGSSFIRAYLDELPGAVGSMFSAYESSGNWRLEDQPQALIEYLRTRGIETPNPPPSAMRYPVNHLTPKQRTLMEKSIVDSTLRRQVTAVESSFSEMFDYDIEF